MALAQGVGRLIRADGDRGVVAVLDPRLANASYGSRLRASLPPMHFTTNTEQALQSLRAIDATAAAPRSVGAEPGVRRRETARAERERREHTQPSRPAGWSESDDAFLRAGVNAGRPLQQLADRHGVSVSVLLLHLRRLDLHHPHEMPSGQPPSPPPASTSAEKKATGKYSVEQKRQTDPQAYARWEPDEDAMLLEGHRRGLSTAQMAKDHGRKQSAIRSRLRKLGLPETDA
jgi:DNA-directed RNA polymerase specialized sigma24 family protein